MNAVQFDYFLWKDVAVNVGKHVGITQLNEAAYTVQL